MNKLSAYLIPFVTYSVCVSVAVGVLVLLRPTPQQPPAPTCKDSFEWIADRCDEPAKHTCAPGQKMEVKDEHGVPYILCRCK